MEGPKGRITRKHWEAFGSRGYQYFDCGVKEFTYLPNLSNYPLYLLIWENTNLSLRPAIHSLVNPECALTGDRTRDLLVHGSTLNPWATPAGPWWFILMRWKVCNFFFNMGGRYFIQSTSVQNFSKKTNKSQVLSFKSKEKFLFWHSWI